MAVFSDEFVTEIRTMLAPRRSKRLFRVADDTTVPAPADKPTIALPAVAGPTIAGPAVVDAPRHDGSEDRSIRLLMPRPETTEARPLLAGITLPASSQPSSTTPNLFVSSASAPAEVTFVPAEEVQPGRHRWVLIVVGVVAVVGALWLMWLAQSGDTTDAPVSTIELVSTTSVSTTASTTVSTTEPRSTTTVSTTVATTAATVAPATAAPVAPATTTPRRPATTVRRPATTAAPATTAPVASEATIPDVSFTAPTWAPVVPPPTEPAATQAPAPEAPAEG